MKFVNKKSGKPLKITIITGPFGVLPPLGIGAVERVWYQIASSLASRGHSVDIIAKQSEKDQTIKQLPQLRIFPIRGFARTGNIKKDLILDLHYTVRALFALKNTDILVLNTFWAPVLASLFRRRFQKMIYNVQRVPKGQLWLYKFTDVFAAVSRAVADQIRKEEPGASSKIHVIPNPIDFETFAAQASQVRFGGPTAIVFTGRLHPEKGLHLLVAAADKINRSGHPVYVKLIGPSEIGAGGGGENYITLLRHKAGSMRLEVIPPLSDRKELADAIASGDIYCYPSVAEQGETFGVAPLEAMAVGVPVIVSSLACFRDFATDGVNALIFDHRTNPEDNLENVLRMLLEDKALGSRLAQAGRKTAAEFSVEYISSQYEILFSNLIKDK